MAEPPRQRPPCRSLRAALTLSETLIAAAVLGLVLIVAALGTEGVRTELKRRQAVALLASLEEALTAYQQATDRWPARADAEADATSETTAGAAAGRARAARGEEAPSERNDGSGDRIIAVLAEEPRARAVLETIPDVLRIRRNTPDGGDGPPPSPWGTLQDPWGQRLRCLTAASPSPVHRKAVAARNGRPIFVSAGVDGRFGDRDISLAADNIRSDELRRE